MPKTTTEFRRMPMTDVACPRSVSGAGAHDIYIARLTNPYAQEVDRAICRWCGMVGEFDDTTTMLTVRVPGTSLAA